MLIFVLVSIERICYVVLTSMFVGASLFVVPLGSFCRKMSSHYAEARNVKMGESRSLNGVDATVRNVSTVLVSNIHKQCRGCLVHVPVGTAIGGPSSEGSLIVFQLVKPIRGATTVSVHLSPCGGMAGIN